jgi:putative nucleotidyltransferase with HDIG domain
MGDCIYEELITLPGVYSVHICIEGIPVRYSGGICSQCQNSWEEFDDMLSCRCDLRNLLANHSFPLKTLSRNYGFLNIIVDNQEKFEPWEPYVGTLVDVASTIMEHRRQRDLLDAANNKYRKEMMRLEKTESALKQAIHTSVESQMDTVKFLMKMGELLNIYPEDHPARVAQLASAIASGMGFSEPGIEGIRIMGLLHDIGKVAVPREILSKPGPLSEIELRILRNHPQAGYDIVREIPFPWPVATAIRQHHERMDGSGYPQGLADGQLILEAKILAVAEVVEAMASPQLHGPALGIDRSLEEIMANRGKLYDDWVVDECLKLFKDQEFKYGNLYL